MRNTFKVYERLKREQHIHTLFLNGKAFSVFPLRIVYLAIPRAAERESPVMTGFSVPKKKFRSSVDRHRIRRLLVEAWRLNKNELYSAIPNNVQLHVFFIFTDTKMPDYATALKAVLSGIDKLRTIAPLLIPPEADQKPAP